MALPVAHRVAIRLLDTSALPEAAWLPFVDWLDESERQRLARFVRPERRWQFLAGRALARRTLGSVLGLAPAAVRLVERPDAAPTLALPGVEQVGFSISHSGRWVACAASATCRVGLDIERVDPHRDIDALAAQAFDAHQQAWLIARSASTRVNDFYSMWSTLEARFKLGGEPASTFDLSRSGLSIIVCCARELAASPVLQVDTLTI